MRRWLRRLWPAGESAHRRWVVVDVETSGMDTAADRLIAIGAVALCDGRVVPADSLELILQQDAASSRDNILVHGVGAARQLNGVERASALSSFVDFVGTAPLLAFHAPFDRAFLVRAIKATVKRPFDNSWLDIAELAPALDPEFKGLSLDEWLQRYHIGVVERHSAAADALATALLAARLLRLAQRQGAGTFEALQQLARNARWLQRR